MDLQIMYTIGCLIAGLAAVVAFTLGLRLMQKQDEAQWKEEIEDWKQDMLTIGR